MSFMTPSTPALPAAAPQVLTVKEPPAAQSPVGTRQQRRSIMPTFLGSGTPPQPGVVAPQKSLLGQ
jgi:hypothetical protein